MSEQNEPGFTLNAKTIAMLVGLTTLMGFGLQGIGYANGINSSIAKNTADIGSIQKWMEGREKLSEKVIAKLDAQTETIVELKMAVKTLQTTIEKSGAN